MPGEPGNLGQFWQELKRRKVIRVIIVYAAASFVILELVSIVAEPFGLPDWTIKLVFVILCVGLIISIILSWIYDITPEGIEKTQSVKVVSGEDKPVTSNSWKIASYISLIVIVALIILNIIPRTNLSGKRTTLEKSIAILPFRNDSPDTANEFFINGIMESILDNLCKIEDLRVIARTSVEQYRDKPMHVAKIAEALNVFYILEGSGQRYENQIRLTVQLIDAVHDKHIWSRQYDKDIEDVFSIQSEIAQLIASEIRAVVTPEVKLRIEKEPTVNMEAYNLYLQGRHHFTRGGQGKESIDQSIQFYQRALDADPDFALAYSGLAASYSAYAYSGSFPRSEVMNLAKEAARKALSIDNTLGEAHAELAWTRIYQDFNWKEGERGLKLALELNPNYAIAHRNYSWLLTFIGRHEESIAEAKRAMELDPLSNPFWSWLARAYSYARDYDRAIAEFQKLLRNYPDSDFERSWLSLAYLSKGMNQEALSEISKVKDIDWVDGYIYGVTGEKEKAQEVLEYYLERSKSEFVKPTDFTVIYTGLGEYDKALEYLEQAYETREGWLVLMQVEPLYDSLRKEPRFQEILDKMNFPEIE
ncbi:MAG: hypothetical protein AMS23_01785 [Bacteroides sp. SM1_62]|nr:MAG: hypothetical protein AMS23_01785 [Bacteroides sp. SM1_62]